ncbi:hypothetical protein OG21DRAFT_1487983 [Imleria badia]|nr:hypothetical protein OG21DRAFT_1487983 [Imleria badia]
MSFELQSLATLWGPMYWGFVFSTILVGATLIQGYMYYNRSWDPLSTQVAVALLLILDLSSTAALASAVSHNFLVNFGNYSSFSSIPPAWVVEAGLTTIVTFIAQVFFASRIRISTSLCSLANREFIALQKS